MKIFASKTALRIDYCLDWCSSGALLVNFVFRYTFLTPYYSSPGSKWVKEFDEGDIVPGGLVYAGTVKPAEQIIGGWEKRVSSPVTTEPELPPAIHYNQVNIRRVGSVSTTLTPLQPI